MTPRQRYEAEFGLPIDEEVIVHELCHSVAGCELGLQESGIWLCDPTTGERARAMFSDAVENGRASIMRCLAGPYGQAKLIPESLPDGLKSDLLDGSWILRNSHFIERDEIPPDVQNSCIWGDWVYMVNRAKALTRSSKEVIDELATAHSEIASLFERRDLCEKIQTCVDDFTAWLDTEDEDAAHWPMIIYPSARVPEVLKAFVQIDD